MDLKWLVLLFGLLTSPAWAQKETPCPTMNPNTGSVSVQIVGSPKPVQSAFYNLQSSGYLWVIYTDQSTRWFMGVPRNLTTQPLQWTVLQRYPEALVQDRAACPILTQAGLPIQTRPLPGGGGGQTVAFLCSLISTNKNIKNVTILNAPHTIQAATYDPTTSYLDVSFFTGWSQMFVTVPPATVNGAVQWGAVSGFPEALMLEFSPCPLLNNTGSAGNNQPILTQNNPTPPTGWIFGVSIFGVGTF